jgi:hypothetical protein
MSELSDFINNQSGSTEYSATSKVGALDANGALAQSSARAMDTFSTCGASVVIMALVTVFSVCVAGYLVHQLLSLIRDGIKSNQELKGAIDDAIDGKD